MFSQSHDIHLRSNPDTKEEAMADRGRWHWVVAGAAIVPMALGIGLPASAAAPALHVENDSKWSLVIKHSGCEREIFSSSGKFAADQGSGTGDAGTWVGGASSLTMNWTTGTYSGLQFVGTWDAAEKKYVGNVNSNIDPRASLVKGFKAFCS